MSSNKIRWVLPCFIFCVILCFAPWMLYAADVETPESHFGFKPGTDRMLFDYEELVDYLEKLDAASDRLEMVEIGTSPQGRPMLLCFISSEENIANLDRLREINERLALDPDIPDAERAAMIEEGKVFFLATLSMHSGEVTPAQALPLIAYDLVTTEDPEVLAWLDDVVYMPTPNHNPDGMDMIVNHYRKYKGTMYEGCSMPGLYHKYVGHDNNRDFITLTQSDNEAVAWVYNKGWYPQVMIEKHQMGSTGPRYFVPPMHDPIAENIDAEMWNWTVVFGGNMIRDMTAAGLAGVSQHAIFDDYWPGSTETCLWKNVIGMLTELASIKYATPIYIEPNELTVRGKGLAEYKKGINMPLPWEGGWWRFSEMMDYEIVSTMSTIKTSALRRKDLLEFRNDLCRREVERGRTQAPYYYVMPAMQHDRSELVGIVNLMLEHGVQVFRLTADAKLGDKSFVEGDFVIPLAQAYRPFIKEVMETQVFPLRHYTPGGEIIRPYDITSWSLPLHRGVTSHEMDVRSEHFESLFEEVVEDIDMRDSAPDEVWAAGFPVTNNESFKAAFKAFGLGLRVERLEKCLHLDDEKLCKGSFLVKGSNLDALVDGLLIEPIYLEEKVDVETSDLKLPRIALVETWFHDMDAGWTRYILDTYGIPFTLLRPGDFEDTDLAKQFDVLIFPGSRKSVLMSGKYKWRGEYYFSDYPPEYKKGMGKKGFERVMTFIDKGGIVISWGRSTELFMGGLEIDRGKDEEGEEFQLPIRNVGEQAQKDGLYVPGAFVKLLMVKGHPLTLGMHEDVGGFYRGSPVFRTSIPSLDMDRRVIARFPEKDILISGYIEKEETISNRSAMVWLKKGKGQLVLFAFYPQHRASTQGTYKLLFNSILLPKID